MKKLQKVIIAFFSVMIFTFYGCEDMLEEEFVSDLGSSNFPSVETAELLINEAYQDWGYTYQNHRMGWAIEWPTPSMQYAARNPNAGVPRHAISTWTWDNNPAINDIMDRIFRGVRSANDAMDLIAKVEGLDTDQKARMVSEAKVLRAMHYFNLVRLWGGVPIVDKPQGLDDDLYPFRATTEETYDFIVKDLEEAIPGLPTRSQFNSLGVAPGHITKGGAQGILAKVFLTMSGEPLKDASYLLQAKDLLEEVIGSGEWALVQSATPYKDLWDWQNEFNSERMIDVQKQGASQNFRGMFGYFTPPVESSGVWTSGVEYSKGSGIDGIPPEYVEWFEARDSGPRFQWTIVKEFVAESSFDKWIPGDTVRYNDGPRAQGYIGKYRAVGATLTDNFACPNNFPVLRYADILLMHSEVTNELGAADYTGLNATRARAGLPALEGLSQDDFRDAVFLERELELAYEQNLFFDMKRRGFEYTQSRLNGFYKANQNETSPGAGDGYAYDYSVLNLTEPHRMLYPYPQNHLAQNPNLTQNPGY